MCPQKITGCRPGHIGYRCGFSHHSTKLNEEKVMQALDMRGKKKIKEIAALLDVCAYTIYKLFKKYPEI